MRPVAVALVFASLRFALPAFADAPSPTAAPPRVEVVASDDRGLRLAFELGDLTIDTLGDDALGYVSAGIPGGALEGGEGEPAVPVFTRFVAVPPGATVRVRATRSAETIREDVRLAPVRDADGRLVFDDAAYGRKWSGEAPAVSAGAPARIRDVTVVPITFRPVRYDAATGAMRVARRLDVEIEFEGGAPRKSGGETRPVPTSFADLYRRLVVNADDVLAGREIRPGAIVIVHADSTGVLDSLARYVEWRTRKGADVRVVSRADAGGTRGAIKSYIQSLYDDPAVALEYIVLVGDADLVDAGFRVPTWREPYSGFFGEGDYPYTQLDGDDPLPDAHIGRLSFDTFDVLSLILTKTIRYETEPYLADPGWFTRGCVVGDPRDSGISTVDAGRWLEARLEDIGYDDLCTVYGGSFVSGMYTCLNRGNTVFGYRGFAGMSGWSNAYTNVLQNGPRLTFAVTLTCLTGSFASGTAISEGFLRAGSIDPYAPRGGIGGIATATGGTHTRYNNCIYYGIWRGFTLEKMYTMGAALTRGRVELYLNYQAVEPTSVLTWAHWNNLMGDPAVDIFTSYPESLAVDHPAALPVGSNGVTVAVHDGAGPCEGALVCLWKEGETHVVGYTDGGGRVDLPVACAAAGEMKITVTKHDRVPYLASTPVADTLFLGVAETAIADDGAFLGGADGEANPGEAVGVAIRLAAFGGETLPAVTGSLATNDPFVVVVDGVESFGDIPAGGTAWSQGAFDVVVDSGCPDGHTARLFLTAASGAESWRSFVDVPVVSAALAADSVSVVDDGGRLDPGETRELGVRLANDGGAEGTDVTVTLHSLSRFIAVADPVSFYGSIAAGGAAWNDADRFSITAAPDAYEGAAASLLLTAEFSGGARDTAVVVLTIGDRSEDDPAGPDGYGYWAFDDADTGYAEAPLFDWVELDPLHGGDGTEIVTNDTGEFLDETVVTTLPFPFRYYGEDFDTLSVSTNGWLSMGPTELITYRNWTIPGGGGPDGILAVFWDNLYQVAASKIYAKHDAANHRFIVEWSRFRNDYCDSIETFEAILYDPAFHPSDTGDGFLVFQYLETSNCDPMNGRATVGIGSPDLLDGLLVTYFGQYSDGSSPIEAGRAIRFVPVGAGGIATNVEGADPAPAAATVLRSVRPNPFNPATTIAFSLRKAGPAELAVYDVAGRRVRALVRGDLAAGEHEAVWDGRSDRGEPVGSGTYFARLTSPDGAWVRRMTIVR